MGYPKCVCLEALPGGKRSVFLRVFKTGYDICFGEHDAGEAYRGGDNRNGFKWCEKM